MEPNVRMLVHYPNVVNIHRLSVDNREAMQEMTVFVTIMEQIVRLRQNVVK